jgi:hypothetical protein
MAFNPSIHTLLSTFSNGVLFGERYRVNFTVPTNAILRGSMVQLNDNNKIDIMCHTCSLPQRAIMTSPVKLVSVPYRAPYSQAEYDQVSFDFYSDHYLNTRRFFESWQQSMIDLKTNNLYYYDDYTTDVTIHVYDDNNNETYVVKLYECFPISVGDASLAYNNSEAQNITVSLSYMGWRNITEDKNTSGFN